MLRTRRNPGRFCSIPLSLVLTICLGSCSGLTCFSFVSNPGTGLPVISAVAPTVIPAGGVQVQLTIIGTNFGQGAFVVLSDGTQLEPLSLGNSQMIVVVPANLIVTPSTLVIRVSNPCAALVSNPFAVPVAAI